jgi:hypothetical protein
MTETGQIRQLRRTYRGEEDWIPLLQRLGHRRLRQALIASGVSPTLAGQMVWFLDEQLHLDRHLTANSRTKYRRVLEGLDVARVADLADRAIPGLFNRLAA